MYLFLGSGSNKRRTKSFASSVIVDHCSSGNSTIHSISQLWEAGAKEEQRRRSEDQREREKDKHKHNDVSTRGKSNNKKSNKKKRKKREKKKKKFVPWLWRFHFIER